MIDIAVPMWQQWASKGYWLQGEAYCGWLGRWYICRDAPWVSRAMDSRVMRRDNTSSCQSAATSKIVKHCCSRVFSCKQRCNEYSDLYLYFLPCLQIADLSCAINLFATPAGCGRLYALCPRQYCEHCIRGSGPD